MSRYVVKSPDREKVEAEQELKEVDVEKELDPHIQRVTAHQTNTLTVSDEDTQTQEQAQAQFQKQWQEQWQEQWQAQKQWQEQWQQQWQRQWQDQWQWQKQWQEQWQKQWQEALHAILARFDRDHRHHHRD